jgi:hypothetical protein
MINSSGIISKVNIPWIKRHWIPTTIVTILAAVFGVGYGVTRNKKADWSGANKLSPSQLIARTKRNTAINDRNLSEHKRLMAEDDEYYSRMKRGNNPASGDWD